MKLRSFHWLCSSTVLMLIACTTPPQNDTTSGGGESRSPTLSSYRTFAIAPLPTQGPSSDPAAASRLNEVAHSALMESLTAKGYTSSEADQAEFIVKVETAFSRDPVFESSERRYLIIGFHDRVNDALLWSNERGRSSSRTLEPELLRKSIIEMLSGLPSAPLTK